MRSMTSAADRRAALGTLIRDGRRARRLSMKKAAEQAEISRTTWWGVERGEAASELTYLAVEAFLGFEQGSFETYLNTGEQPARKPQETPEAAEVTEAEEAAELIELIKMRGWFKDNPAKEAFIIEELEAAIRRASDAPNPGKRAL